MIVNSLEKKGGILVEVNSSKFLEDLSLLKFFTPGGLSLVEQKGCCLFVEGYLATFDGTVFLGIPFDSELRCLVDMDSLSNVIRDVKGTESVSLSSEGTELLISCEGTKAGLPMEVEGEGVEFISARLSQEIEWKSLPGDFLEALKLCSFSASKDATQIELTGVYITDNHMVSSDDYKMTLYELSSVLEDNLLIPASSVRRLVKIPNIVKYGLTDSWIYFLGENGLIFGTLKILKEYPPFLHFFDVEGQRMILPAETGELLDVVGYFSDGLFDLDKEVVVNIGGGKLTCRAEGPAGWTEKEIQIRYPKDASFVINPIFFSQLFTKGTILVISDNVVLLYKDRIKHVLVLSS